MQFNVHVWLTELCAMGKYTMNDDVFFLIIEAEKEILHEGILSLLVSYLDDRAVYSPNTMLHT